MASKQPLPEFLDRYRILSIPQAAEALGYSVAHLRRLYRTGKLPQPTKIGERKLGYQAGTVMDLASSNQRTA